MGRLLAMGLAASAPLAFAECPGSARLEEALRVVDLANPVLLAAVAVNEEAQQAHDWKSVLTIGYDTNTTYETGAAGARAAVNVQIPLFDHQSKIAKVKERAALVSQQDTTREAFLGEIQTLCELTAQVGGLNTLRALTKDRLSYRQERVNQGLDPADSLWKEAEALNTNEQQWESTAAKLTAKRLLVARRYGGEEWQRLQTLLTAMTR